MNPLVMSDLKLLDHSSQIRRVESQCFLMNKKHFFRFPLDKDFSLVWSKRHSYRLRLQLHGPDHDGLMRMAPFVDADDFLMERYVEKLPDFLVAFTKYCQWEPIRVWV